MATDWSPFLHLIYNHNSLFSGIKTFHELCVACRFIRECYVKREDVIKHGKGQIRINKLVNHNDSDYEKLYSIAEFFAKDGADVYLAPKMTRPGKFEYNCIFNDAEYPPKCPDLKINGIWYEHEGYTTSKPKNALRNMFNDGLKQASRIIIERPELTDRHIIRSVFNRLKNGANINEVWILEPNGTLSLIYKKTDGQP